MGICAARSNAAGNHCPRNFADIQITARLLQYHIRFQAGLSEKPLLLSFRASLL
jgi:hypothetical protein